MPTGSALAPPRCFLSQCHSPRGVALSLAGTLSMAGLAWGREDSEGIVGEGLASAGLEVPRRGVSAS